VQSAERRPREMHRGGASRAILCDRASCSDLGHLAGGLDIAIPEVASRVVRKGEHPGAAHVSEPKVLTTRPVTTSSARAEKATLSRCGRGGHLRPRKFNTAVEEAPTPFGKAGADARGPRARRRPSKARSVRVVLAGACRAVVRSEYNNQGTLLALRLLVGVPTLTCGQDSSDGNFGTLRLANSEGGGQTQRIARNIANALNTPSQSTHHRRPMAPARRASPVPCCGRVREPTAWAPGAGSRSARLLRASAAWRPVPEGGSNQPSGPYPEFDFTETGPERGPSEDSGPSSPSSRQRRSGCLAGA